MTTEERRELNALRGFFWEWWHRPSGRITNSDLQKIAAHHGLARQFDDVAHGWGMTGLAKPPER